MKEWRGDGILIISQGGSAVASVVNKLDRRWVLLTTRPTCHGEIFQVHSLGQIIPEESTLIFRDTHISSSRRRKGASIAKPSSINPVLSIQYHLWQTDGRTDRRTRRQHIYGASKASRGKQHHWLYGAMDLMNVALWRTDQRIGLWPTSLDYTKVYRRPSLLGIWVRIFAV